jgi:hypothetical protein
MQFIYLSQNTNATYLLERNLDKVHWTYLSANPKAISILKQNIDKLTYL